MTTNPFTFPRHFLARLTLLFGVVAVGLVVIPTIAYDRPMPWSTEAKAPEAPAPDLPTNHRFTLRTSSFQFSFGKSTTVPAPPQRVPAPPPKPVDPTKPYQIAAVILGLTGMISGPASWNTSRRARPLAIWGMVLCFVAIAWHYVIGGVILGVAAAILLFILGSMG